jgi:hypothetical protein
MHIIEKISMQMQRSFVSTDCSFIQKVEFKKNSATHEVDILVSFVYESEYSSLRNQLSVPNDAYILVQDHEILLLHLLFESVLEFRLERDSTAWKLGELLFYDDEDGSPICVSEELGSDFYLTCKDIKFIGIEPLKDRDWVMLLDPLNPLNCLH